MKPNADMVPPTGEKPEKAPKAPKAAKTPKAETSEATGEKKERAPRQDYNYFPGAVIELVKDADTVKFSGQRLEWWERVKKFEGKTCQEFCDANKGITNAKGNPEPPRGWLRAFAQQEVIKLTGEKPEPKAKAPKAKKEAAADTPPAS